MSNPVAGEESLKQPVRTSPLDDAALADWFASDGPVSDLDFVDPEVEALSAASGSGNAGFRIDAQLAFAEFAERDAAVAMARQLSAIRETMAEARQNPGVFVGEANAHRPDAVEFAERAAVTELAACLRLSPSTIRSRRTQAEVLDRRLPRLAELFQAGGMSYRSVQTVVECSSGLPDDDAAWAAYDECLAPLAARLATARLREQARKSCEKLSAESLAVRHARARADRRVWVDATGDSMAWLGALLPAADAYRGRARVKAIAKHLAKVPGEGRTQAQIEADVLSDLLTGDGTPYEVKATVGLTVPVLTAIGSPHDTDSTGAAGAGDPGNAGTGTIGGTKTTGTSADGADSGVLEGYGPIDPDTARRLTAHAPSFYRILTDPVSSAVIDVDRRSYRPPADLKRWVTLAHPICAFPGCGRSASECEIDHNEDWAFGGKTALRSLAPLCKGNHRLRHRTKWTLIRNKDGTITWRSPRGKHYGEDPPPF